MKFLIDGKEIEWSPEHLLIGGYTAKDQKALKEHVEELEKIGVAAPKRVPMIYQLSPELLSNKPEITTVNNDGSGEAEVVLLDIGGTWHVGLGSDHTDRVLEATNVQKSKQVCAKPVTTELWSLESIQDHWDSIKMKSWMIQGGEEILYQDGKLDAFLSPKELLSIVEERGYPVKGIALLCGTLPIASSGFIYGEGFKAELFDPVLNRRIVLDYKVKTLRDAEED